MNRVFKYKRKKGPVVSKKVTHDGVVFASGLEKYMYIALKKAKLKFEYEGQNFTLIHQTILVDKLKYIFTKIDQQHRQLITNTD